MNTMSRNIDPLLMMAALLCTVSDVSRWAHESAEQRLADAYSLAGRRVAGRPSAHGRGAAAVAGERAASADDRHAAGLLDRRHRAQAHDRRGRQGPPASPHVAAQDRPGRHGQVLQALLRRQGESQLFWTTMHPKNSKYPINCPLYTNAPFLILLCMPGFFPLVQSSHTHNNNVVVYSFETREKAAKNGKTTRDKNYKNIIYYLTQKIIATEAFYLDWAIDITL